VFTGIVEEIGTVRSVRRQGRFQELTVAAQVVLEDTRLGDSISIDGVCQTVTRLDGTSFTVETLDASLDKTTLGTYRTGRKVNLERAVTPTSRMGGHIVQGHVDGTATVREVRASGHNVYFSVELPPELAAFTIPQGSIAVDGTSLTISELTGNTVVINVIPTTWKATVLADRRAGDTVNIEVDVLARYVARLLSAGAVAAAPAGGENRGLTAEGLRALGY
jgi:riboflavin synthase